MKWFYDLKIGKKLITAFLVVSAFTAFIGIMGIKNMATLNEGADRLYHKELMGIAYIKAANVDLIYLARAEKNLILSETRSNAKNSWTRQTRLKLSSWKT